METTVDAVRMRARRGTLRSEKGEDGRVYVWVEPDQDGDGSGDKSDAKVEGYAELVEDLRDQVGYLRGQLATRDEELRRKDHLLAALVQRVPELEAPREPSGAHAGGAQETREGREKVREGYGRGETQANAQAGTQAPQRSFWSRLFGG